MPSTSSGITANGKALPFRLLAHQNDSDDDQSIPENLPSNDNLLRVIRSPPINSLNSLNYSTVPDESEDEDTTNGPHAYLNDNHMFYSNGNNNNKHNNHPPSSSSSYSEDNSSSQDSFIEYYNNKKRKLMHQSSSNDESNLNNNGNIVNEGASGSSSIRSINNGLMPETNGNINITFGTPLSKIKTINCTPDSGVSSLNVPGSSSSSTSNGFVPVSSSSRNSRSQQNSNGKNFNNFDKYKKVEQIKRNLNDDDSD